jgi:hypothetical protein
VLRRFQLIKPPGSENMTGRAGHSAALKGST